MKSGLLVQKDGVHKLPRDAEVLVAGGWTVAVQPETGWTGTVVFKRNATGFVAQTLRFSDEYADVQTYYASTQVPAFSPFTITGASTWLIPFTGYELYVQVTGSSPAAGVNFTVTAIAPVVATKPTVTLAQLDLTQGIPLNYPDDLKLQFQLAADQQPASLGLTTV